MIAVDKVGREDHQVGAAGVTQRREQNAAKPGGDDPIRKHPGRRNFFVDTGDLSPGTVPVFPRFIPDSWVEPLRKVDDFGEHDLVGGKGGRWGDAGALPVFLECRLGRTGQIERFDAWPVETTAVDRRARATGGQESPFWREIAVEDLIRTDVGDLHPRAPFSRSRMKARTASTWPSATSSAAGRWP